MGLGVIPDSRGWAPLSSSAHAKAAVCLDSLAAAASVPSLPCCWHGLLQFCRFTGGTRDECTPCVLVPMSCECIASELDG